MTIYEEFALAFQDALMNGYLKSDFVSHKLEQAQNGQIGQLSRVFDDLVISDVLLMKRMLVKAQQTKNLENHLNKVLYALLEQLLNDEKTDFKPEIIALFDAEMLRNIKLLCNFHDQSYIDFMMQALVGSYMGILAAQFQQEVLNTVIDLEMRTNSFSEFNEEFFKPIGAYIAAVTRDKIISGVTSTLAAPWLISKKLISFLFLSSIDRQRPLVARAQKVRNESFKTLIKLDNYLDSHGEKLSDENILRIKKSIKLISKQYDKIEDMLARLSIPVIDEARGQVILDQACKDIALTIVNELLPIKNEQAVLRKTQGPIAWLSYQINKWLEPKKNLSSMVKQMIKADPDIYSQVDRLKFNALKEKLKAEKPSEIELTEIKPKIK
jgi:hypothetical protein